MIGCEDEKLDCNALIAASNDAYLAYLADLDNPALCNTNATAYKAALDGGCTGYTAAEDSLMQEACNILNTFTTTSTYLATSVIHHIGGDCSVDDGYENVCTTTYTLTESECIEGECIDGSGDDEESCADGLWSIYACENNNNDDCEGFDCYHSEATTEAACDALGGDWAHYGWTSFLKMYGMSGASMTLNADLSGTLCQGNDECGSLTWSAVESAITFLIANPAECSNEIYTTQTECEGNNYAWEEASVEELECTISSTAINCEMGSSAECSNSIYETQAECVENEHHWNEPTCSELIFTLQ